MMIYFVDLLIDSSWQWIVKDEVKDLTIGYDSLEILRSDYQFRVGPLLCGKLTHLLK